MAGKEKEPHSWRLLPEQVFIGPNSNIFTPEGSIRFGIYVRAKAIESLPNDSSSREQLTQEMSEEYYKLYSSKNPPPFPDFIKEFIGIVQKRIPYLKLDGELSGKWSILPVKKKSFLTRFSELLQW
ncbi:MAG: hypothetical protein AAB662_03515 [Patescibacteria group bacterium]